MNENLAIPAVPSDVSGPAVPADEVSVGQIVVIKKNSNTDVRLTYRA